MTRGIKEQDAMLALVELLPTMRKMQAEDNSILSVIARLEKRISEEPSPAIPYIRINKKDALFIIDEMKKLIPTQLFLVFIFEDKGLRLKKVFSSESSAAEYRQKLEEKTSKTATIVNHQVDFQVSEGESVFVLLQLNSRDNNFESILGIFKTHKEANDFSHEEGYNFVKTSNNSGNYYSLTEEWFIS